MILEVDLSILNRIPNLSSNQLLFLSLVLKDIKKVNQDVQRLLSLVSEDEILSLQEQDFISVEEYDGKKKIMPTRALKQLLEPSKALFEDFYNHYPSYATRPDGTKSYLRNNLKKCKQEYEKIVRTDDTLHDHIIECLNYEVNDKIKHNKMSYMKTMWSWITQREWETIEEQMKVNTEISKEIYGTKLI